MARFGRHIANIAPAARRLAIGAALAWLWCAGPVTEAAAQAPIRLPPADLQAPAGPLRGPAVGADLNDKLRERGDLVLSETTLRQALFTISESWQINLVVGEDVSGQVNGVFKNAPLHEILHSILFANGYGYRVVGQGLVVMKLEALGDSNPLFVTETIVLRSLKPEDVLEGANLLRSPQGKLTAIPSARALMIVDLPERITAIRTFVEQVDNGMAGDGGPGNPNLERRVAQFVPQFVKVMTLKESLDAVLSKDGKAVVIEAENRVVIVDYPPNLELAGRVLRELDVPRPQVRITALIYDVSLDDLERLGINWNHAVRGNSVDAAGNPEALWAVDSLTQVPTAAGSPAATMTFMNLSRNFDISATIDALCNSKDAQLLADPSVTVVDRESATIQIVTEIPYQQLTQTQQGGNIGTTAFREAGVTLKVTPHIALDSTVQMEVTPTFSRLTGFTNGQSPQPIIDKREAQTTVRVADQQWLVIGGLRQRTAVKDDRAIPKLSGIKHIGKLFQSYDYSFRESELVVFLKPEIVTPEYCGYEREQHVMAASNGWLEEMPVAPHVLGHGEVGCPNCGQLGCKGCGKAWKPWQPERRQVGHVTTDVPQDAVIVEDRAVHQPPRVRRLPSVEQAPPMPPPDRGASSRRSTDTQQAAKPKSSRRTMFGIPPLTSEKQPATIADKTKADAGATAAKPSTRRGPTTAKATPNAASSKAVPRTASKPAEKRSATSWMTSWFK